MIQVLYTVTALIFGAALVFSWFGSPVAEPNCAEYRLCDANNRAEVYRLQPMFTIGGRGCDLNLQPEGSGRWSAAATIFIEHGGTPTIQGKRVTVTRRGEPVHGKQDGEIRLEPGDEITIGVGKNRLARYILERDG